METTYLERRSREIPGQLYDVTGAGMYATDTDRRLIARYSSRSVSRRSFSRTCASMRGPSIPSTS
jgi:hypothetical protein